MDSPRHDDEPTPVIGSTFAGRYRIQRKLGEGGMGAVFAAEDLELGEFVALKVFSEGDVEDGGFLRRLRREVVLARRVTHPNAARTYDVGVDGRTRFLTMELVEGQTLRHVMRHDEIGVERGLDIVRQIASGLSAAHRAGVVHRDLKPENVLVERGGRVVVTDFGVARSAGGEGTETTHAFVGTPDYMAPEQLLGEATDARTDVYGLGLLACEVFTGRLPFVGEGRVARVAARLSGEHIDPITLGPMPPTVAAVIRACLSRDPAARPPHAGAVLDLLHGSSELHLAATGFRPFATAPPTSLRLLVAQHLRSEGTPAGIDAAEAILDEVADVLATTRGLSVARVAATSAPIDDARRRDATALASVSVRDVGGRLRLSVRLIEVAGEAQLWTGRYELPRDAAPELEDQLAWRIAEALRLGLVVTAHRDGVGEQAVELYLQARNRAERERLGDPTLVVRLLERSLEIAPRFGPALAAHALASLQCWFMRGSQDERDWGAESERSVGRAVDRAGDLAESHFARGVLANHLGRTREAVEALMHALELAPTYADAHDYLGRLECEVGRVREGMRRLELSVALSPDSALAWSMLCRAHALEGDLPKAEATFERLREVDPQAISTVLMGIRLGAWFGSPERARLSSIEVPTSGPLYVRVMRTYARAVTGDAEARDVARLAAELERANPRQVAVTLQLCAEMAMLLGEHALALECVHGSARGVLVDLHWTDRCPLLAPIRDRAEFREARELVAERCDLFWEADTRATLLGRQ